MLIHIFLYLTFSIRITNRCISLKTLSRIDTSEIVRIDVTAVKYNLYSKAINIAITQDM